MLFQKSIDQLKPLWCVVCCNSFRHSRVVGSYSTCWHIKVNTESFYLAASHRPGLDVVWMIYRMLLVLNEWPNFFLFEPWLLQITELQLGWRGRRGVKAKRSSTAPNITLGNSSLRWAAARWTIPADVCSFVCRFQGRKEANVIVYLQCFVIIWIFDHSFTYFKCKTQCCSFVLVELKLNIWQRLFVSRVIYEGLQSPLQTRSITTTIIK